MKKIILFILAFFSFSNVYASTLVRCVDGDTAVFNIEGKIETVRFLAIDTPESTNKQEEYGKEASEFTCEKLKNARKITIETDPNSQKYDKYNRLLGWVFVDGNLIQKELLKNGLAEIKYIYGDYSYMTELKDAELSAKNNNLGIWGDYAIDYTSLAITVLIVIVLLITFKGNIKKTVKYLKKIEKLKWYF